MVSKFSIHINLNDSIQEDKLHRLVAKDFKGIVVFLGEKQGSEVFADVAVIDRPLVNNCIGNKTIILHLDKGSVFKDRNILQRLCPPTINAILNEINQARNYIRTGKSNCNSRLTGCTNLRSVLPYLEYLSTSFKKIIF